MQERLKQLRAEKGLTQQQVANSIGITKSALANYEVGLREPSIEVIKAICRFYEVTSDYLIGLSDNY